MTLKKLKKKEKPERKVISGYVEESVIVKVDAIAAVNKMTRSEAVEALLEESLEDKNIVIKKSKVNRKAKKK